MRTHSHALVHVSGFQFDVNSLQNSAAKARTKEELKKKEVKICRTASRRTHNGKSLQIAKESHKIRDYYIIYLFLFCSAILLNIEE